MRDALAGFPGNPRTTRANGADTRPTRIARTRTHIHRQAFIPYTRDCWPHGPVPRTWSDATDMRRRTRITMTSVGDAEPSTADMFSCHSKDPELFTRQF